MDVKLAGKNRQKQIAELEEWGEKAYHSAKLYKERTKRWHDHRNKLKEFKQGDKVKLLVKENCKVNGKDHTPSSMPHGVITI
jgi:ribosomal protein L21E